MSMPLVILGTGGSAFDLLDLVESINADRPTWEPIGFLDDAREPGTRHLGLPVLGSLRQAAELPDCSFVNAIVGVRSFRKLPGILASTGMARSRFATMIHPAASVSSRASLGRGVVVNPGVVIGGGVSIGDHVMICPGCVIGHESRIGDACILAPGSIISGLVQVEPGCYLGARAVVREQLRIGAKALVGMGAVVVTDVDPGSTVVGNPARVLRGVD